MCTRKTFNQQLYVLALENALITHFAYEDCDRRLANNSLQPGKLEKKVSAGHVVYMAFKYEDKEKKQMNRTSGATTNRTSRATTSRTSQATKSRTSQAATKRTN